MSDEDKEKFIEIADLLIQKYKEKKIEAVESELDKKVLFQVARLRLQYNKMFEYPTES